jgi:hypothetical protein
MRRVADPKTHAHLWALLPQTNETNPPNIPQTNRHPPTTPHPQQRDVRIKLFFGSKERAVRDMDDGEVGAEVGKGCCVEGAEGGLKGC